MNDIEEKPWWQSRTIIGALVVVLAQALRISGYEVDSAALTQLILDSMSLLGAALAMWGRVKANAPISKRVVGAVKSPALAAPPARPADWDDDSPVTRVQHDDADAGVSGSPQRSWGSDRSTSSSPFLDS